MLHIKNWMNVRWWMNHLRDPMWQFIGVVMAVATLVVSCLMTYDIAERSRAQVALTLEYNFKYGLTWTSPGIEKDLTVLYKGGIASNLAAISFVIENTGNVPILPDDYIIPLSFSILPSAEIVSVDPYILEPQSLDIKVTNIHSNTFELSNSLLNPGDRIGFYVTTINDPDPNGEAIIIDRGRIAGLRKLTYIDTNPVGPFTFTNYYFQFTFWNLALIAFASVLLTAFTIEYLIKRNSRYQAGSRYLGFKFSFISCMSFLACVWGERVYITRNNTDPDWWAIWRPATIFGGSIVAIYLFVVVYELFIRPRMDEH